MFFRKGGRWRTSYDVDKLILEDCKVGIAFLEDVGTEGEFDGDVVSSMRLWRGILLSEVVSGVGIQLMSWEL
jgi:hypothetical protein